MPVRRLLVIAVVCLALLGGRSGVRAEEAPKTSPFGAVRWEGERAHVEVAGASYELLGIDRFDLPAIVAFARKTYAERWAKRIEEDLGEVLAGLGGALGETVDLRVREAAGTERRLERVPSTKENRRRLRDARQAAVAASAPPRARREHAATIPAAFATLPSVVPGTGLSGAQAAEDLDQLEAALEQRFAYLRRLGVDYRMYLDSVRAASAEGTSVGDFTLRLQSVLARFGDGHSAVEGWESVRVGGFAPFLLAASEAGPVAFRTDRSGFVDERHPVLVSIDGLPLERWLAAAARLVPDASPAFRERHALRALRHIALLRRILGLPEPATVALGLQDAARTRRTTVELPLAERKPTFGDWPRTKTRMLEGQVGYWRVAEMDGSAEGRAALARDAAAVGGTERLVVDVRGNGGGDRSVSLTMLARLLPEAAGPRVVNAAVYRLQPGEAGDRPGGWLADRELFPVGDGRWSADERGAIEILVRAFKPEWQLAEGEGSALHVAVVRPVAGPRPKHIVVLLDGGCFSATDIFLGGIVGTPGVKLVGTPSGGGSGRKRTVRLVHSAIEVALSSMVSYRPDGHLFDGRGVEPDLVVAPAPTDLLGTTDRVLDRALEVVRK